MYFSVLNIFCDSLSFKRVKREICKRALVRLSRFVCHLKVLKQRFSNYDSLKCTYFNERTKESIDCLQSIESAYDSVRNDNGIDNESMSIRRRN